jgi:hypothetical protein
MINPSNINWFFSGGLGNNNPLLSLGGEPSTYQVYASIGSALFNNVTEQQSIDGYTDYRCVYLKNLDISPLYNAELFMASDTFGGAEMYIGCNTVNQKQKIFIVLTSGSGYPNLGSVTFLIGSTAFTVPCPTNTAVPATYAANWATNFKNAILNSIVNPTQIYSCNVVGTVEGAGISIVVEFTGVNGNTSYPNIVVAPGGNTLSPASTILTSIIQSGSPVNLQTQQTNTVTETPVGIDFTNNNLQNPINLGTISSNSFFPVWIKRVVAPGTSGVPNDGFDLVLLGSPF